jgi:small-conductance mechanosensitive channel
MQTPTSWNQLFSHPYLDWTIFNNTLVNYLSALFVLIFVTLLAWFVNTLFRKIFERAQTRSQSELAIDVARATTSILLKSRWHFFLALGAFFAINFLSLPAHTEQFFRGLLLAIIFFQFWRWSASLIEFLIIKLYEKAESEEVDEITTRATLPAILITVKIVLFLVFLLMGLENFGINVTALLAGLGVGGIAIGLASQKILGDLFASISIVLDKPFRVGDFIRFNDSAGTVVHIGMKSTRIRSVGGEEIVLSNSDLLNGRINNFRKMRERRINFTIGVVYQTKLELLQKIPDLIKDIIEATPNTRFDRAHFSQFGSFSLDFQVVYFVLSNDFPTYMNAQQAINLALFKKFQEEGIEFAYPSQSIFVENVKLDAPLLDRVSMKT